VARWLRGADEHGTTSVREQAAGAAPARWGLSVAAVQGLAERLVGFWQRFAPGIRTRTRESSA
jgi:hypothetical protein